MSDLEMLYKTRFSEPEEKRKNLLWVEICRFIKKKLGKDYDIVVDVAAGYCDFINNFATNGKKIAVDINPDMKRFAAEDVEPIVSDIGCLGDYFSAGCNALFFMSNFLEHITKSQIEELFKTLYDILGEGGNICVLTPNIRYVGNKYWDFFDHITPITEKALIERAESLGFQTELCVKRFLPFTTKSALPQAPWIVRLYLKLMPLSGLFFGEQSLLVFAKRSN